MTAKLPFTEHSLRRRIAAAEKEGYRVTGITSDGTVLLVHSGDDAPPLAPSGLPNGRAPAPSKWRDREV